MSFKNVENLLFGDNHFVGNKIVCDFPIGFKVMALRCGCGIDCGFAWSMVPCNKKEKLPLLTAAFSVLSEIYRVKKGQRI